MFHRQSGQRGGYSAGSAGSVFPKPAASSRMAEWNRGHSGSSTKSCTPTPPFSGGWDTTGSPGSAAFPAPNPNRLCLVHRDFNPTNLLAENGEITAVLDWEFAMSGPPLLDLANLCRDLPPSLQPEIAAGLADEGVELPREWPRRCRLLDLGSHLEFLTSNLSDDFKRSRVALIDQLLAEYGAAPSAPGAAANSTRRTALRSPSARAISDNTTDPAS